MTKRVISLSLAGLMLILTLTGCGTNEIGYLKLVKEIGIITKYEFSNSTQIEVYSTAAGEDYNIDLDLKGSANIEDLNSIYMNLDIMFKVNDIESEHPVNLIMVDNKMYVSKNALLEMIRLSEKYTGTQENAKVIDELYNVELNDRSYILIYDLNEYYSGTEYKESYKEMYDIVTEYLTSAFKSFDSKLVTKINNGYAIELTSESTVDFIERLIKYVSKNRELVFDETVKYIENIYDSIGIQEPDDMTVVERETDIEELKESRQEFYDFIDEAVLFIKSEEFKEYEKMFNRSEFKEEIYKKGSSYLQDIQGELVFEDIIIGNLHTRTEITPADVEKTTFTKKFITADDLGILYNMTESRINPVNKIELSWDAENYYSDMTVYRLDGTTDWDYLPYAVIEGKLYLPLKNVCEIFGESYGVEVQVSSENKKEYVEKGTEKVYMKGTLINDTTMVKIREFEKLGYKIGYVQVDGVSTVTVEK